MSVTMLDSIRVTAPNIPRTTRKVAGYVTGSGDVPWHSATWAMFPHSHVRIDQAAGLGVPLTSDVADYEPGCKTLGDTMDWLHDRAQRSWWSTVYVGEPYSVNYSMAELTAAVRDAKLRHVQYGVCRPDLNQTEAIGLLNQVDGGTVWVQWATPASNPNMVVPGGHQTLKVANVDVGVTCDSWFARSA